MKFKQIIYDANKELRSFRKTIRRIYNLKYSHWVWHENEFHAETWELYLREREWKMQ